MSQSNEALNEAAIRQLVPFNEFLTKHQFQEALKCCEQFTVPERKKLFKRGDSDDFWFYLLEGAVNLIDEDFNTENILAEKDSPHIHALDSQPVFRNSAITKSPCTILKVDHKQLDLAISWDQASDYLVEDSMADDEVDWMSALLDSDVFAKVPPSNIQTLFGAFKSVEHALGDIIVSEGQAGDRFYVIEHGSVIVTQRSEKGEEKLAKLSPGQFFGEEALVGDTTRNATVTMETDGALMYLDKEEFKALLEAPVLNRISAQDLTTLNTDESDLAVIDVRLTGEFKHFHRDNSINIPLNKLRDRMKKLDKKKTYIVDDNAGSRSELGFYLFIKSGFHAYLLEGSPAG